MRLFIAIELPEQIRNTLAQLNIELPGVRRVPPEQLHLTLHFLGDVDAEGMERLCQRLAAVRESTMELRLTRTGCFPDSSRPRIVWAGVECRPSLLELFHATGRAVAACGIALEKRHFKPHITLARIRTPMPHAVAAGNITAVPLPCQEFPVTGFTLFQSRLTPEGAVHSMVQMFPLQS